MDRSAPALGSLPSPVREYLEARPALLASRLALDHALRAWPAFRGICSDALCRYLRESGGSPPAIPPDDLGWLIEAAIDRIVASISSAPFKLSRANQPPLPAFRSWCSTVVYNVVRDTLGRPKGLKPADELPDPEGVPALLPDPDWEALGAACLDAFLAAIGLPVGSPLDALRQAAAEAQARLRSGKSPPPGSRAALSDRDLAVSVLVWVDGLPNGAVATRLKLRPADVSKALQRARDAVQAHLQHQGHYLGFPAGVRMGSTRLSTGRVNVRLEVLDAAGRPLSRTKQEVKLSLSAGYAKEYRLNYGGSMVAAGSHWFEDVRLVPTGRARPPSEGLVRVLLEGSLTYGKGKAALVLDLPVSTMENADARADC